MSLAYRLRQFTSAITAQVSPDELALVERTLTPSEQQLFASMPLYDQRHCLDVYATLCDGGVSDPLLLRAAMFHDCGKVDDDGRPMPLIWYTFAAVVKTVTPGLYHTLAASGRGPLRPLRVYAEHAWRGSRFAAAAGSPSEIVEIIRHYHDERPTGRAAILQWADEQN